MTVRGYEIFNFVSDALLFITLVATAVYCICANVKLHRRRDPARRVFSYVKFAWVLFTIAVLTSFIETAMGTVISRVYQSAYGDGDENHEPKIDFVARLASGADAIAHFFNILAEIAIFLTLVSLIRCIRVADSSSSSSEHPRRHTCSRYLAYGISFAITILSLTVFSIALYAIILTGITASASGIAWDRYFDIYSTAATTMDWFCQGVLALIAITMLIRSIVLRRKLRASEALRKALKYLIVCCCLWLLRACFDIYIIIFQNVNFGFFPQPLDILSSFNELTCVIFFTWPMFIILAILYYLGIDANGLVSAERRLLMEDGESQTASSEPSERFSREQSTVTPMAERPNTTVLTPAPRRPESLFACDGLVDAPPEYSPAVSQQGLASAAAAPASALPLITDHQLVATQSADHPTSAQNEQSGQSSDDLVHPVPGSVQPVTAMQQTPVLFNDATEPAPVSQHLNSPQGRIAQALSTPPPHDEAMELYHQADGRPPGSASTLPPDDDEMMGLYHQADGRPPTSSIQSRDDETTGLYHQTDGRPPESSNTELLQQAATVSEPMSAPPSHDEAMGLYHQADGRVPQSEMMPYPEKEKR